MVKPSRISPGHVTPGQIPYRPVTKAKPRQGESSESSTHPDLLDALEGIRQEGEEVAASLDDVLLGSAQADALLLEDLGVEPNNKLICTRYHVNDK